MAGTTGGRPEVEQAFGIDIGGSGIKAAVVDVAAGALHTERRRYDTPQPATPHAIAAVIDRLTSEQQWTGRVGAAFPAVIKNGIARSAANVAKTWIGTDVDALFTTVSGCHVTVINDADAAGLAEVRFGAGRDVAGVVLMLTLGTGIGSALFLDGRLVPNTELGHVELDGHDAESRAAASVRDRDDLSWHDWASRVQRYLRHLERLFTPDLFIIGGGVSKKAAKWLPQIELDTPVTTARLMNDAGIVGAAIVAAEDTTP